MSTPSTIRSAKPGQALLLCRKMAIHGQTATATDLATQFFKAIDTLKTYTDQLEEDVMPDRVPWTALKNISDATNEVIYLAGRINGMIDAADTKPT